MSDFGRVWPGAAAAERIPAGRPRGQGTDQPGQHPHGTTSGGVPAPRRRRPGHRPGWRLRRRRRATSAPCTTTPAARRLMSRPGAIISTYDYVADTRYSWGGIAFPFSGGPRLRPPGRHVRVQQPAGLHGWISRTAPGRCTRSARRSRASVRAELLRPLLGPASPPSSCSTSSARPAAGVRGRLRHQLPLAMLNGHPIRFAFVVANLGTNLKLQR